MRRLAVIGTGRMGAAVVRGLIGRAGWSPSDIVCTVARKERGRELAREFGVPISTNNASAVSSAEVVLLALKPQMLLDELTRIADSFAHDQLVVTIAAGITTEAIEQRIGDVPVVRAMPNTPLLVAEGMTVVSAGRHATAAHVVDAVGLFSQIGSVEVIDEREIDAVTAVSGTGPAYVFRLAEAWMAAGIAAGLNPDVVRRLVVQTLVGSAEMLRGGADPARLRSDVTSPGGTTEAAMAAIEAGGFDAALKAAVAAAHRRARQLGR